MIGVILFIILFLLSAFAFYVNGDIFSPTKFYFFYLLIYFLSIFFSDYSLAVYLTYSFYLLLGSVLVFFELRYLNKFQYVQSVFDRTVRPYLRNPLTVVSVIVLLSLIPVAAQGYIIMYFGGIENYLLSMVLRVQEWKGLNMVLSFRDLLPVLNLVFLIILFTFKIKRIKICIIVFIIHLILTVLLGLLTGSRSWILNIFLSGLVAFNYLKFRIRPVYVISSIFLLLIFSEVLQNFRTRADKIFEENIFANDKKSIADQVEESATFKYGLNPLVYIYEKDFTEFQYGKTYFTFITNFIPRKLWPDKPESAGTILTRFHEEGFYSGLSGESPGYIAEAIINFGYFFAFIFVFIFFIALAYFVIGCYLYLQKIMLSMDITTNKSSTKKLFFAIALVIYTNQILGALTFAESTNVFFHLVKNLLYISIIIWLLFKIIKISTIQK